MTTVNEHNATQGFSHNEQETEQERALNGLSVQPLFPPPLFGLWVGG